MPRTSPYRLALTDAERTELEARARRYTSPYSEVVRAKIVLYAAEGLGNDEIAARLDTPRQVVSKWRKRFHEHRLPGLADQPRGGRPPSFSPDVVVAVKALARELPTTAGVPPARWHRPDLARTAIEQGIVASISGTTIGRWLSADAIKPWQHRSWIFPRDPDFATTAARVLDLYARRFDEAPLGPDEYVISADEKTSIQARIRRHPTTPPAPGAPARVEHEYARGGALAYLAAWDVHRAQVFGRCEPTTVRPARRAGHDQRTVCHRAPGVLDRRQRFLPPRPTLH
jgi:transposase